MSVEENTAVDAALVEKAARVLFDHCHAKGSTWQTEVEEYREIIRGEARAVLAAVLPDVRRANANGIADEIEAVNVRTHGRRCVCVTCEDFAVAAGLARRAGDRP